MDRLIFCTTPQEYIDMYKVADSCMAMKQENTSDLGWVLWKQRGLWSSMWYANVPRLKGFVVEIDGEKVARGFVMDNEEKTQIGPIYWDDSVTGGWFFTKRGSIPKDPQKIRQTYYITRDLLIDAGYVEKVEMMHIEPFNVPGVEWKGQYYCPLPHVDFIAKPFRCQYDPETHEFKFDRYKGGHGKVITSTYEYSMWLTEKIERAGKPVYAERAFSEFFRSWE